MKMNMFCFNVCDLPSTISSLFLVYTKITLANGEAYVDYKNISYRYWLIIFMYSLETLK
jgi:hypothetical protein